MTLHSRTACVECVNNASSVTPQVLLGQASIQNLSLLGRGEIEFRSGSSFGWFDLGSVTNLTTLHIKTDRYAYICIPAAMHLQSLEIYAPFAALFVKNASEWAKDVAHLRLVYEEFRYCGDSDGRDVPFRNSPFWPMLPSSHRDRESECSLYATFCEVGKGACIKFLYDPYEEEEVSWGAIKCMVLEGCKFDTGMSAAMDVYNGAVQACSCSICWVCMRAQKID